jgi:hypothetical protein
MGNENEKNSTQFMQVIIARGESYNKLMEWPKLNTLLVLRMPLSEPNVIGIIGSGEYYENVLTDDLACSCINRFATYQEGSCLKELVIYLAERATHGCATFFS